MQGKSLTAMLISLILAQRVNPLPEHTEESNLGVTPRTGVFSHGRGWVYSTDSGA